ncbi:MAG: uridine kinase [Bacteroidia bacterium]
MPYFVGISGGSASGKTTFIEKLKEYFESDELTVLSQDHYYKPLHFQVKDEKGEINFDEPESIDLTKFLKDIDSLEAGDELKIEEYIFNHPNKNPEVITVKPAKIIVIEGLFIFGNNLINDKLNFKIFIDADENLKYNRRLLRDIEVRGMNETEIENQWNNHVLPSYQKHLLPHKEKADLVINNNLNFDEGFELTTRHFKNILINCT